MVPTKENNYQGQNIGGWRNDEFDRLTSQAVLEFDPERRKQLFWRAQEIWAEELPGASPLLPRQPLRGAEGPRELRGQRLLRRLRLPRLERLGDRLGEPGRREEVGPGEVRPFHQVTRVV